MLAARTLMFTCRRGWKLSTTSKTTLRMLETTCEHNQRFRVVFKYQKIPSLNFKCYFHTTPRRDIPPALALLVKPLTRAAAFLFGRYFKRWWKRKTPEEKEMYIKWFSARRQKIYGALGLFLTSLLLVYGLHMEIDPLTGRRRLILLNPEQQKFLGKLAFEKHLEESEGEIVSTSHPAYVRLVRVLDRLLKANADLPQIHNRNWTVTVIDSNIKNAYVLPNGNIFMSVGMMHLVENDDQLAVVLAHEMSHVLALHSIEQISRDFLLNLLLIVPLTLVWAVYPDLMAILLQILGLNLTDVLVTLPYSRKLESEADYLGLKLVARACFDVRHAVVFWELSKTLSELDYSLQAIPWLSTHPDHEDRAKNLAAKLNDAIALRSQSNCPRLHPSDPIAFFNSLSLEQHAARLKARGIL